MSSDDVVDLLRELETEQARELLDLMGRKSPGCPGTPRLSRANGRGLMTTEYVALPHQLSAGETIEALRIISPARKMIYRLRHR